MGKYKSFIGLIGIIGVAIVLTATLTYIANKKFIEKTGFLHPGTYILYVNKGHVDYLPDGAYVFKNKMISYDDIPSDNINTVIVESKAINGNPYYLFPDDIKNKSITAIAIRIQGRFGARAKCSISDIIFDKIPMGDVLVTLNDKSGIKTISYSMEKLVAVSQAMVVEQLRSDGTVNE